MHIPALITGVAAVVFFLLSYQQKTRRRIITFNVLSRTLYVLQYLLLHAFEGAALDILGMLSSLLAQRKNTPWIRRHIRIVFLGANLLTVAVGLLLYENVFSLFPIAGVVLHTSAFWMDEERKIRLVSLLGSPFWLVYNLVSGAYGSAAGDLLTIGSICIAIWNYDIRPKYPRRNHKGDDAHEKF
ncbi:MAG: YgjV family protein [Clostridia bacterium]|nr:YgjV family protein [Clostridia bacterium]